MKLTVSSCIVSGLIACSNSTITRPSDGPGKNLPRKGPYQVVLGRHPCRGKNVPRHFRSAHLDIWGEAGRNVSRPARKHDLTRNKLGGERCFS